MSPPCASEVKWIMIRHFTDGLTVEESAKMLYRSKSRVDRTRAFFRTYGDVVDPFVEAPGKGGQKKLDEHVIDVSPSLFSHI